jgi:Dynamin family/Dynamin central region
VKLPQIIAVGDQSAGKSSVLEAITGIPFPHNADACTRFPTEIRLRHAKNKSSSVYIIPDTENRPFAEQERLRSFRASTDGSHTFKDLMKRAVEEIAPINTPGRFAAGDILVIEKQGPDLPLLTVVDLPGLVRIPNNSQSPDDLKAIDDITNRYMKSPRAIILAVVGGNGDYSQAPVLQKARDYDPAGERTIGVLTKPDLTNKIGLEDKFLALVNNRDKYYHLDLGWYVLLNPGPSMGEDWPSTEDRRQAEEAFFALGKWSTLPRDMCGAKALEQKLSAQLQRHIGKHVRALQRDIQKAHDECRTELKSLGNGKDTVEEMKTELVQLWSDSEKLAILAVQGTYTNLPSTSFFPKSVDQKGIPPQNLRARAFEENGHFAERIKVHGRKVWFTSDEDPQSTGNRGKRTISKSDYARDVVERHIRDNKGTELQMDHNPRLVYPLFQDYAENWSQLAQQHKDALGVICNEFLSEVIDHIWPRRMQEPLRRELLDPKMRSLSDEAQNELEHLGNDLHYEIPIYGSYYEERVKEWRANSQLGRPSEAEELLEKMLIYYDV